MHDVREWLERRSYDYAQFADPVSLAGRKRELSLLVSVFSLLLRCLRTTQAVRTLIDETCTPSGRASGDLEQLLNHDLARRPKTSRITGLRNPGTVQASLALRSVK